MQILNILSNFTNPEALWASAIILIVILLYLLRPKPRDLKIPSIMFIMDMEKKSRLRSFLRRIVRDPLLLIQLLIIALLIFAAANPFFITWAEKTVKEDAALVIDGSASMQARDIGGKSRFSRAMEISREIVEKTEGNIDIILAENVPVVVLRNGSKTEALSILNEMECKSTPTDIGSAILLAKDLPGGNRSKKIYVLSDFSNSRSDPLTARQMAFNEGIDVEFIEIHGGSDDNVGVINLGIATNHTFFNVKNYNNKSMEVGVKVLIDNVRIYSASREIKANSYESFSVRFDRDLYRESILEVIVSSPDDVLEVDNAAYGVIPATKKHRVLLISEKERNRYLEYALTSSQHTELERADPPIIPSFNNFDIIILGVVDKTLLPGDSEKLRSRVQEGGSLIVMASEALTEFNNNKDFNELMPVTPLYFPKRNDSQGIDVIYEHEILKDVDFEDVIVSKYYYATANKGSAVIAEVNDQPFIAYKDYGGGKVVFVGANDNADWSDFHLKPSFPIFYMRVVKWLSGGEGKTDIYNFDAGSSLLGAESDISVVAPSEKRISAKSILLDEIGIYRITGEDKRIGVSLNNEKESDIGAEIEMAKVEAIQEGDFTGENEKIDVKNELYALLLIFASIFIFLELIYLRGRGQI
ncbi:MAG: hypothetical protein A7316_09675 [Candidatus Altiarchaeales archaeon WOR_SM1_86-2]|nr:MAG: hypothetical protein A7316_09675 [Candidatus Altiarchaeales archaeon WOR_SM1_86-2]